MTITSNVSTGVISWAGLHIQFGGQNYTIADGSTNKPYVYWIPATSTTVLVASDTYLAPPTIGANDLFLLLNKGGVATLIPTATWIDGDLIVPGSITAGQLAANCITAGKIAADAVETGTLAVNALGALSIAAQGIKADMIDAEQVFADSVLVDALLASTAFIAALKTKGIEITSGTSLITMKLENGQISILDNGETVAYFNDQLMHIRNAEILEMLGFGPSKMVVTANGFCIR